MPQIESSYCWTLYNHEVDGQWPNTEIDKITITDQSEIHKFNLLQGVNAFQEVFGPVGCGEYLEEIIQLLCDSFPDEEFIQGNRGDLETLREAQDYATGMTSKEEVQEYKEKY